MGIKQRKDPTLRGNLDTGTLGGEKERLGTTRQGPPVTPSAYTALVGEPTPPPYAWGGTRNKGGNQKWGRV